MKCFVKQAFIIFCVPIRERVFFYFLIQKSEIKKQVKRKRGLNLSALWARKPAKAFSTKEKRSWKIKFLKVAFQKVKKSLKRPSGTSCFFSNSVIDLT